MPRRWNPCSFLPRRLQIVASIFLFTIAIILIVGNPEKHVEQLNPFKPPVHRAPPEQANSTTDEVSWFADFKWQNPFSDRITFDEDRSVLPPEKRRPTIYTYFDPKEKGKDEKLLNAELELVNVWRRAWWAKGFKPMVLGPGEAKSNPLYSKMAALKLAQDVEFEALRWLAWSSMGTGILCNWLAVPMSNYSDPLLDFLRRGEFPDLTRFGDIGDGIFVGVKTEIQQATAAALNANNIGDVSSFIEAIPSSSLTSDRTAAAIAFYSGNNIDKKYSTIKDKFNQAGTLVDGLTDLAYLINSHLHTTWQSQFHAINVLKPIPRTSTNMIEPAIDLARNLSQCSWSPLPNTCPPNIPACRPCVAQPRLSIGTPSVLRNESDRFTIATIPHPYTLNCLFHEREGLNPKFVRRQTKRDLWIWEATKELMGTGIGSSARLPRLKDGIASDSGQIRSLWLNAETSDSHSIVDVEELEWLFGFQLPRKLQTDGKGFGPVPGPERRPPPPKPEYGDVKELSPSQLEAERRRLETSQQFIYGSRRIKKQEKIENMRLKNFVEAWNLADTEAWKFVRALNARRGIERRKWEEEERAFLGQGMWDRLVDQFL